MKNKDIKFKSLTPEILPRNKEIYTEALDYAFSKDDIRNIAITGVFGAGKSTVWNTYRKQKSAREADSDFDNIITVCLGKYNDKKEQNDNKSEKELENRVERQIINQITAQIKSSVTPMSKYKYKGNLGKLKLSGSIILTLLFFGQFFLWSFRKEIVEIVSKTFTWFDDSVALYLTIGMFISSVGAFLFQFYRKGRLKFSKVQYKDMEAQFTESNQSDETILERDMKEIVYLLSSSNTSVVVFEDLDRYDSVDIFIKLKELNFLLNAYLDTNSLKVKKNKKNKKNRIVRFIYLIKDGFFYTKDRTKFFDFILPIIPVVDSKTSENHLIELLGLNNSQDEDKHENSTKIDKQNISLDKNILRNIALYIDDMRILRNIVNEFKVYSSFNVIDLNYDKLFALVTVKNIYPREFELLQQDKGYIFDIFNQIDKNRIPKISEYEKSIENKRNKIIDLVNNLAKDKYEKMSLLITKDVEIVNHPREAIWSEFLLSWDRGPGVQYEIKSEKSKGQAVLYDFYDFLNTFVYTSDDNKKLIQKIDQDNTKKVMDRFTEIKDLEQQIEKTKVSRIQDYISNMRPDEINELFKNGSKENTFSEYPLVRYLIVEGLLDETYWYYKGNFDVDNFNTLKRNDHIFLKRLLEKVEPDVFFKLDSPKEIMDRLEPVDFNRFSILNLYLFEECVINEEKEKILNTLDTVDSNGLYNELIQIINSLSFEKTSYIIDVLVDNNIILLEKILDICSKENQKAFGNLTYSILMNENIKREKIMSVIDYIEDNENLIEFVKEENLDKFIERAREKNIKFNDLEKIIDINEENYTDIIDKIMPQSSNGENQIEFTTYEPSNDSAESDSVGFGKYLDMSSDNVHSSILDMIQNGTNNDNDLIEFVEADERLILDDTEIMKFNISFAKDILIGNLKERLIQIEKHQLYRITLNNIIILAENILGEKIKYENLLSKIYENDKLKSMQEYIDNHFDKIVSEYIEQNSSKNEYANNQEILIKILNSNISLENKQRYVDKNSISINNLEDIYIDTSLIGVLLKLFDKDKVTFTSSNLDYYWNLLNKYKLENNIEAQKYVDLFIEVLNKRLSIKSGKSKTISTEEDIKQILSQCDSICNALINSKKVDDNLFVFALENATKPIEKLDQSLDKERIEKLSEKKLIKLNEENNKTLKDKLNI